MELLSLGRISYFASFHGIPVRWDPTSHSAKEFTTMDFLYKSHFLNQNIFQSVTSHFVTFVSISTTTNTARNSLRTIHHVTF